MLVLTRKSEQKIRIGNDIVVTVLRVQGRTVKVGIEAPLGIRVMRDEIPVNEFAQVAEEAEAKTAQGNNKAEPEQLPADHRPMVAEAAMSMDELAMIDGRFDPQAADEMAPSEPEGMKAPLSFHIARRLRIIHPNKNSNKQNKSNPRRAIVAAS